jgi:predicted permease
MPLLHGLRSKFLNLFGAGNADRDLDAEVLAHLDLLTAEKQQQGMTAKQARRAARIELGGVEQVKEEVRAARSGAWLEAFWQDLRFAARQLRRNPGFAVVAVLTLALGVGANTAIFSVVKALLLRPYPFPELDRIVLVRPTGADQPAEEFRIAPADFVDLKLETRSFERISAFRYDDLNLTGTGLPESVAVASVTPEFFDLVGVHPALGRSFVADEGQEGANRSAILSYGYWHRRFAGDPRLVGGTIQLNGRDYAVVGVMPPRYAYPLAVQVWLPLALTTAEKTQRGEASLHGVARLREGTTLAQAGEELRALAARLAERYPKTNAGRGMDLVRLREEQYQFTAPLFLMLQLAAGFLLLLACANLVNLLFARVIARQREIALRATLGASPRRMAQLFLMETLLVSLVAAGVAAAVSGWTVGLIRTSLPPGYTKYVAGWDDIRVDGSVLLITVVLAVLAGAVFGIATAAKSSRIQLNETLKAAGAGSLGGRSRLRSALVSVQVVLAMVLLTGAGLMIQGFVHLVGLYQGLDPVGVVRLQVALPKQRYAEKVKAAAFFEQALRSAAALPGVQSAAVADNTPASNVDNDRSPFQIEGQPARAISEMPVADLMIVSADYFRTLRIPPLAGRVFSDGDRAETLGVAVISQSMARRFWPGRDPAGERVKLGAPDSESPWWTIVGVVGNVKQNWWDPQPRPTLYRSYLQVPQRTMTLLARAPAGVSSVTAAMQQRILQLDPQVAPTESNTLEREIADALGPIRVIGILMMVFGGVALALSAVGVYGVLAQTVAQRTREFGIRMALGANPQELLRLVLRQALRLTGAGLAVALPVAFMLSRAMESLLFGVVALRWTVLAGFSMLLLVVALAAGILPALRATRADPLAALREE